MNSSLKLTIKTGIITTMILCLYSQITFSQTTKTVMETNKELVREGFANWANGTGSFFDLLADDVQWTITGSMYLSKTYTSKKQFLDEVIDPLNERLSKRIVPKVTGIYADGDMVIVIWDGTATATDGKPYNASYSWNMEMKNGKIVRVIAFLDGIEFQDIMTRLQPAKK
jgi:ketosteroid isomerase-like protein